MDARPGRVVTAMDWHPTAPVMATGGADGLVRVWVRRGSETWRARGGQTLIGTEDVIRR